MDSHQLILSLRIRVRALQGIATAVNGQLESQPLTVNWKTPVPSVGG
ncbi:hypothetical protein [Microcoleus sp. N3A4]